MQNIPTLYDEYQELLLDLDIFGKITAVPTPSLDELRELYFEEFKERKPLPTLEGKRYELSDLVSSDYKVVYSEMLELNEKETLMDFNNPRSAKPTENISFEDLTPLLTSMTELFSYECNIKDSDRKSIMEKYDLASGEEFKQGVHQIEHLFGSVKEDSSSILTDEEIDNIGNTIEDSNSYNDSSSIELDDGIELYDDVDLSNYSDNTSSSNTDDSNLVEDSDLEVSSDDDNSDFDDDYDSDDDYDDYSDDEEDNTDDYDSYEDDEEDDYDDYSDEDGDSDSDDSYEDTYEDEDGDDSDDSDEYDDYSDEEDEYDDYSDDEESNDSYEDDSIDSSDEEDDEYDDYSDDEYDDYSDDEDDEYGDYSDDEEATNDNEDADDEYDDYSDDEDTSVEETYSNDVGNKGVLDIDVDDVDIEFEENTIVEENTSKVVETPITPAQIPRVQQEERINREEEPTDLRKFLRKHPRCDIDFALQYFSKKEINDAIRVGKIIKKGNKLRI